MPLSMTCITRHVLVMPLTRAQVRPRALVLAVRWVVAGCGRGVPGPVPGPGRGRRSPGPGWPGRVCMRATYALRSTRGPAPRTTSPPTPASAFRSTKEFGLGGRPCDLRIAAGAGGPAAPGPRAGPRLGRTIQALTHRVPGARTGRGCGGGFRGDHQGPRGADGPSWLSTTGWRPGQFLKRGQKVTMRWLDASGIAWSRCLGLAADDLGVTRIMFCRVRGVRVRLRRRLSTA